MNSEKRDWISAERSGIIGGVAKRDIAHRGSINRTRPAGWLPPSLQSRVDNVTSWVARYRRWAPITQIVVETVRFDMQLLASPEISGVEYQQGTLYGYELREYLLEKWGANVPTAMRKTFLWRLSTSSRRDDADPIESAT
jgi:hypothetical protein